MDAGQEDVLCLHYGRHRAVGGLVDHTVFAEYAVVHPLLPGEPTDLPHRFRSLTHRVIVVGVEHSNIAGILVCKDVCLCIHILLIVLVDIQMVRRQIGGHRDMGACLHGHQLEGTELQHRHILRCDLRGVAQQRMADIAAHMDDLPLRRQQLGDNGGGGRLAVGAGHRQNGTGADCKECLHLRGDDAAAGHSRRQLRHIRPQTGGTEDHILMEVRQISAPQTQLAALSRQSLPQFSQILFFIPGGDVDPPLQEFFDQGTVGYAHADHTYRLSLQGGQIFFKGHKNAPL